VGGIIGAILGAVVIAASFMVARVVTCPQCRSDIDRDALICPHCRSPLISETV
jgi:predicted amidophosphoribosyltransferase